MIISQTMQHNLRTWHGKGILIQKKPKNFQDLDGNWKDITCSNPSWDFGYYDYRKKPISETN